MFIDKNKKKPIEKKDKKKLESTLKTYNLSHKTKITS
jgi:hypothetical protein